MSNDRPSNSNGVANRAAIAAATLPILMTDGAGITTRRIAEGIESLLSRAFAAGSGTHDGRASPSSSRW